MGVRIQFTGARMTGKTVLARAIQKSLAEQGVEAWLEKNRDDDVLHIDNDFNPKEFAEMYLDAKKTVGLFKRIIRLVKGVS
jgi:predicted AAA+ superfamily ATPase